MTMLSAALDLARLGMGVFPVFGVVEHAGTCRCACMKHACAQPAKHPVGALARNGVLSATRDLAIVATWWTSRDYNIGLAIPPRVIVIDVDPRHGGDDSLKALETAYGALPFTWRAFTGGGGEHMFLSLPDGVTVRNSANALAPGIDIRTAAVTSSRRRVGTSRAAPTRGTSIFTLTRPRSLRPRHV